CGRGHEQWSSWKEFVLLRAGRKMGDRTRDSRGPVPFFGQAQNRLVCPPGERGARRPLPSSPRASSLFCAAASSLSLVNQEGAHSETHSLPGSFSVLPSAASGKKRFTSPRTSQVRPGKTPWKMEAHAAGNVSTTSASPRLI